MVSKKLLINLQNKNGWVRITEAFFAILLLAGVLIAFVQSNIVDSGFDLAYEKEIEILKVIQFDSNLRSEIVSALSLPISWENFESSGLSNTKNKIQELTPVFFNCTAKLCEIADSCLEYENFTQTIYSRAVVIGASSSSFSPRQLKLFCWEL